MKFVVCCIATKNDRGVLLWGNYSQATITYIFENPHMYKFLKVKKRL